MAGVERNTRHPFFGKVDMTNIALGGHSRGGEAVAIAAAFNRLPHNPDDARQIFDYNFDIRSIFALAPVDGQYQPVSRPLVIDEVNYLVIHGAHDMDVISFMGAAQYERVRFSGDDFSFKAALYVEGANHGQFNTAWGRHDVPRPAIGLYNTRQLMAAEEQQQIAEVVVSAFLETTLRDDRSYLPLFQDISVAANWLPATGYLSRYDDSTTFYVSTFDEDLDLTTTTLPGGKQYGEGLTEWYEGPIIGKLGSLDTHAAFLGWDTSQDPKARYSVELPDGTDLAASDAIVFDLADASTTSDGIPFDLTLEFVDSNGEMAHLQLSQVAVVRPQIQSTIAKADWMNMIMPPSELVFQTYTIPLALLSDANAQFDVDNLAEIHFVFDQQPTGKVALSQVGFRGTDQLASSEGSDIEADDEAESQEPSSD